MSMTQMATLTILLIIVLVAVRFKLHVHLRKGLPAFLYGTSLTFRRLLAGLTDKRAHVQDHEMAYLEGGSVSKETVVLLHDFSGDKDTWLAVAGKLRRKGYHVVVPDLPGFGETAPSAHSHYDIMSQVRRLRAFTQKIGLGRFHLFGCAMGGSIAGIFAGLFPKDVLTLAMIEPFGIDAPVKSEIEGLTERGWSPLTAGNEREFDRLMGILFSGKSPYSGLAKRHFREQAAELKEDHDRIWKELWKNRPYLLESVLPQIKARTLVIAGDSNKVFHQSALKPLNQGLTDANVVLLKRCGHWPMTERPKETLAAYQSFLATGGS